MDIEDAKPGMYVKCLDDGDYGVIKGADKKNNWIVATWLFDHRTLADRQQTLTAEASQCELVREDEYLAAVLSQG